MKHRTIILGLLLLGMSGCVHSPGHLSKQIEIVERQEVQNCILIGEVVGQSYFSYLALGIEIAKDQAKEAAARVGATHIVWLDTNSGFSPYAIAQAYRCPKNYK